MSTLHVTKDPTELSMTIAAELDAHVDRAWELWADPRQFERWWGPPGYPVTVATHDLTPGGRIAFSMSGPEGESFDSIWEVVVVDKPHRLLLRDADVDENGRPNDDNSMTDFDVRFADGSEGGAVMTILIRFDSLAGMEQAVATGVEDGMRHVFDQIDAVLRAPAT